MSDLTPKNEEGMLEDRLRVAERDKEGTYEKRTEHFHSDGTTVFINRLIHEDSPYLLQHAHNPVNWFPWGTEAFEVARSSNRPIFLSIGYSTCHWCHVMEVESFDNVEVAKVLNESFISIKMDREQYPDIDEIYMTGLQLISGHGGWPMSNFLLPSGKPFFAGTYFPPPNFVKLLLQISDHWKNKYSELEESANKISDSIGRMIATERRSVPIADGLSSTVTQAMFQREDRNHGGLAGAPKFPQEPLLFFMLERAMRDNNSNAVGFVKRALEAMARGGMYDQVAGGFHRYSVDSEWLVPHFEKMLYNQSQLTLLYLLAYRFFGDRYFARVCKQTIRYVLRDMQLPEGGFYSATDADSEGREGLFFTWDNDELNHILKKQEFELVVDAFGISENGNFEGSNILYLTNSFAHFEGKYGRDFECKLDSILDKLYDFREQRVHPLRDDKLIVAWASAFISTLGQAGFYFSETEWIESAEKAVNLIVQKCVDKNFRLSRIYLNQKASIEGQLEDYVNLIEALICVYDLTGKYSYLQQANFLMHKCLEEFWDSQKRILYLSPSNQVGPQLTRSLSATDGAILSPISAAIGCLYKLHNRSALFESEIDYKSTVEKLLGSVAGDVNDNTISHTSILRQIDSAGREDFSLIQYANQGLAKISAQLCESEHATQKALRVGFEIAAGWHVTAAQTDEGSYSPLSLEVSSDEQEWRVLSADYPPASGAIDTADSSEVPVYKDGFQIIAKLRKKHDRGDSDSFSASLKIGLQLCNDQECLLPCEISFRI